MTSQAVLSSECEREWASHGQYWRQEEGPGEETNTSPTEVQQSSAERTRIVRRPEEMEGGGVGHQPRLVRGRHSDSGGPCSDYGHNGARYNVRLIEYFKVGNSRVLLSCDLVLLG